jgi:Flp pilus assembly pilin Flp
LPLLWIEGVDMSHLARLRTCLAHFLSDRSGTTAIEYALIAAGVGATVAGAIYSVGSEVKTAFYDKLLNVIQF